MLRNGLPCSPRPRDAWYVHCMAPDSCSWPTVLGEGLALTLWAIADVPEPLSGLGIRGLLWWQGLGLLGAAVVAAGLAALSSWIVRRLLVKAASRTSTSWDDRIVARAAGPLTMAFWVLFMRSALGWLRLDARAEQFVDRGLHGLFLADLLWLVWRLVDVAGELAWTSRWSLDHPGSRALIPLARRVGKAFVGAAAGILFLSALGYPVTSLIAGLGLGGLALALASQKTVENLFGAFSLGIDQPFREGDFVRVDDLVGTVESLGLRSSPRRPLTRFLGSPHLRSEELLNIVA
jgi:MscS family membrane protein